MGPSKKQMTETQIIPIENGELVYTHWEMLTQISKKIMDAGISKVGNPTAINLIILKGKRLGLDIFEAIENISVINNKTSINGALASALVERSGLLTDKSHEYKGDGDARSCAVTVQRKGRKPSTWSFSIKEAKHAGLFPGKPGSGWSNYPDSMLYWRALGFCYRREFPDVLQGMYLTEELVDEVPEIKIVTDNRQVPVQGPAIPPPFEPDPTDPKAHEHPIIAEPSNVQGKPEGKPLVEVFELEKEKINPISQSTNPVSVSANPVSEDLANLCMLAGKADISNEMLVEIVNGLRLFPRGVEHKLESLPEAKVKTLLKNWETVLRQADRLKTAKEEAAKETPNG
jgi:hypothetical protein